MRNLNYKLIKEALKEKDKTTPCTECEELLSEFELIIIQLKTLITNRFKKHELAQWINAINWYITLKEEHKHYDYKIRSIVYVELGTNIGNEMSYEHLAVVLKSGNDKVFIVPCSSSDNAKERMSKNDEDYMLGTTAMGFPKETVIHIKEAKWISKTRVKDNNRPPRVHPDLFDKIYERVFKDIFKSQYTLVKQQALRIEQLLTENNRLISNMVILNMEVDHITSQLNEIRDQRDEYYRDIEILTS